MPSPQKLQAMGWLPGLLSGRVMICGHSACICSMCSCSSRTSQKPLAPI